MKPRITNLLLAAINGQDTCKKRIDELAHLIQNAINGRYSLCKMRMLLCDFAKDSELVLTMVDILQKVKEQPSIKQKDFEAWLIILCSSREHNTLHYVCNVLIASYERHYRTKEMLVLCDVLHALKGHTRTHEITNKVCDYFFRERCKQLYGMAPAIPEADMAHAEYRLPELDKAVFSMKVKHYCHRTFIAEELAQLCGIHYSLFRKKFLKYLGIPASEWLRNERMKRIYEDFEFRVELSLKEVAERHSFSSPSNFCDFCRQQSGESPGSLKEKGYKKWIERRMEYWSNIDFFMHSFLSEFGTSI